MCIRDSPKAALAKALEIAEELGLATYNADSYIGWAQTGEIADGQKFLATITHTDVVPEGNGWDADPYTCLLYTSGRSDRPGAEGAAHRLERHGHRAGA